MMMMWIWMRTGAFPQRMWVMKRKMMMTLSELTQWQ